MMKPTTMFIGLGLSTTGHKSFIDTAYENGLLKKNIATIVSNNLSGWLILGEVNKEFCSYWQFQKTATQFAWVLSLDSVYFNNLKVGIKQSVSLN